MTELDIKSIIYSPILTLGSVVRYSGVYLSKPESVADHTLQVCIISVIIGKYLINEGEPLSLGDLSLKAIFHDIDESVTCDIPRNIKYFNFSIKDELDNISNILVNRLGDETGFNSLHHIWKNSKDESIEGFIIRVTELVQVTKKIIEEISLLGNMYMIKVLLESTGGIDNLIEFIETSSLSKLAKYCLCDILMQCNDLLEIERNKYANLIEEYRLHLHQT
jgi:5'-deoxynucleotidase YfbR-like HD superfamily hydrolase